MFLKQKKYSFIDMLIISLKTSPFYSIFYAVKCLTDALLPTLSIFVTAHLLDNAVAVYNKEVALSSVYVSIMLIAGIMIYNVLINVFMQFQNTKRVIYYRRKLIPLMVEKTAKLEYHYLENQKTADIINRVCPSFDNNVWDMFCAIINLASLGVFIIGIMATLFTQVWWIALSMFIVSIPILYIATKAGQQSYNADKEMSKIDRRANYLSGVLRNREAVEERNIYGYTKTLNARYAEKFEFARIFRLRVERKNFIKLKMGGIVTSVYSIGAMLAMLKPVADGNISIGMFIALMGAVFELSQRLSWGINGQIQDLSRKREYLRDLTDFMELAEHEGATAIPEKNMMFKKIEFRNVSFRYPGTEKLVLDNISFTIEYGKHYSVVGVNGAGKTTVTKLLTGLYTNYEGEILVDGCSLRNYSDAQIKGLSSVVYQDFARYYISLYDNIAVGNTSLYQENQSENRKEAEEAVKRIGLSGAIERLRDGIDTPLGKVIENGVDISGGEWQRVAMARCIISNAPLKILDEPTAALDPVSESTVYKNFEHISKGKTTIFISHRLGSTKLADVIFVLSDGKIAERGSHDELMEINGIYCEMFTSQAEWYRNSDGAKEGSAGNE